jgi:transposase-like protein
VHNGLAADGRQRYLCRDYARVYTPEPLPLGSGDEVKREAVRLYLEGTNFRRIGRIQT